MLIVPSTLGCGDKRLREHSAGISDANIGRLCHFFTAMDLARDTTTTIMGKNSTASDHALSSPFPGWLDFYQGDMWVAQVVFATQLISWLCLEPRWDQKSVAASLSLFPHL